MAYIPPHKQRWKEKGRPSQITELTAPRFEGNRNPKSFEFSRDRNQCKQQWKEIGKPSETLELPVPPFERNRNPRLFQSNTNRSLHNQHWKEEGQPSQTPELPATRFGRNQNLRSVVSNVDGSLYKQHSTDKGRPSQTSDLLPKFEGSLNLGAFQPYVDRSGKIVYGGQFISRWFGVGLDVEDQFPSYIHLRPISLEPDECKIGEKPLILVNGNLSEENGKPKGMSLRSPWAIVAENVLPDILSSFEILRDEVEYEGLEKVKPTMVARFGKMLFHRGRHPSVSLNCFKKNQVSEKILKQLKRTMHANIPPSYMENVINAVVPKVGLVSDKEKDRYLVKLSDNTRTAETVSCKCSITEDKKLLLYKVELSQVRQMVIDISCLDKNLDVRLMLRTKTSLVSLTGDEMNGIRDLINSAIIDSDLDGGLRWPQGMTTSDDRYSVIGVWHTMAKTYKGPSLRLKVRHADRFNVKSGIRESSREVYMKLKGIIAKLREKEVEIDTVKDMLKDSLRLIWDNFLSYETFLK